MNTGRCLMETPSEEVRIGEVLRKGVEQFWVARGS